MYIYCVARIQFSKHFAFVAQKNFYSAHHYKFLLSIVYLTWFICCQFNWMVKLCILSKNLPSLLQNLSHNSKYSTQWIEHLLSRKTILIRLYPFRWESNVEVKNIHKFNSIRMPILYEYSLRLFSNKTKTIIIQFGSTTKTTTNKTINKTLKIFH